MKKNNEQDRVITIPAGKNAISVLYAELEKAVRAAVRSGQLLPIKNGSQFENLIICNPYKVIAGKKNVTDDVRVTLLENGSFFIETNTHYCNYYNDGRKPIFAASKQAFDNLKKQQL